MNLYAYLTNDPANDTDPLGEFGLVGCGSGALGSLLFDAGSYLLSGRKPSLGEVLGNAAFGCASGAVGAGLLKYGPKFLQAIRPIFSDEAGSIGRGIVNVTAKPRTVDQTLRLAERFLGEGYREIGRAGSGVYRAANGLRQFRMTASDILGSHGKLGAHVHSEHLNRFGDVIRNIHVPLIGY